MRHYYDSRLFPFLSDLLFDQLENFDWATSRKELEEERKEKECTKKHGKERCNYLRLVDDDPNWNKDIKFYSPQFELVDDQYVYKTVVPKDLKASEIKISATEGSFYFGYEHKSETGSYSTASLDTLPEDLDIDSMKAVVKNGTVTITAKKLEKKPEPEPEVEEEDEVEYEIEIEK